MTGQLSIDHGTTATVSGPTPGVAGSTRLTSLDAFRGATMLFMASEIMGLPRLMRQFPDSGTAQFMASMLDHRPWVGCSPWDLIQPAFMFMVGVAMPFAFAARAARGDAWGRQAGHAVKRAAMLVLVGVLLVTGVWDLWVGELRNWVGGFEVAV